MIKRIHDSYGGACGKCYYYDKEETLPCPKECIDYIHNNNKTETSNNFYYILEKDIILDKIPKEDLE
jgi:hypothetical protein